MMKFRRRSCAFIMMLWMAVSGYLFHSVISEYWISSRMNGFNERGDVFGSHRISYDVCDDIVKNSTWHRSNVIHVSPSVGIGKAPSDFNSWDLLKQADQKFTMPKPLRHAYMPKDKIPELVLTKPTTRPLRVFIVPHSHNDPGWLKTLEGYYEAQTKPMLNAMVDKLIQYPNMTFIWVESVFLQMWWSEISDEVKKSVHHLIEQRRLEIVSGGWVMPDEANPTYYALIDQLIEGHQWLEQTLMVKPNNSWSVDPFGYSSSLAYICKKAGLKNMAIQRIHHDVKDILANQQSLEFRWRQHWDTAGQYDMFTMMMLGPTYTIADTCGPDKDICLQFDFRNRPRSINEGNVGDQAKRLLGQYYKKAKKFKHSVLLIPIGADFRYDIPSEWDAQYINYQMLINHMNSKPEWNVVAKFGTLQDYFDAVHEEMELRNFPTLSGDFYPYTDFAFWTGYFTTRAFQKKLCRELENHLRAADMLLSLVIAFSSQHGKVYPEKVSHLYSLQYAHRSLGLFQHHDAITGTSKAFVTKDYEERLIQSLNKADTVLAQLMEYLLIQNGSFMIELDDSHEIRTVAHDRKILSVQGGDRQVIVLNPIAHKRQQIIRVLVNSDQLAVFDDMGCVVPSQLHPHLENVTKISQTIFELLFYVSIGPLATRIFMVHPTSNPEASHNFAATIQLYNGNLYHNATSRFKVLSADMADIILENSIYLTHVSPKSGFLQSITMKNNNITTKVNTQFLMYNSVRSGAYTFRPTGPAVDDEFSSSPLVWTLRGPLLSEVHSSQQLIHHTVRLYNTSSTLGWAIEVENAVDLRETMDREIVMRFNTEVANSSDHYFVDLNSLHAMKRGRLVKHPLEANFYPMNSMAYLDDKDQRLSIHSAQPHGCSSLMPGQLEIVLDRRLKHDDGKGLQEGVTDNKLTPSKFYLTLERKLRTPGEVTEDISFPSLLGHTLSNFLNRPLFSMFLQTAIEIRDIHFPFKLGALPCDVRLVAVRPVTEIVPRELFSFIIILHRVSFDELYQTHMLDCSSTSGSFTLSTLLPDSPGLKVLSVKEMTLSLLYEKRTLDIYTHITIQPMDIVTYKISFQNLT